MSGRMLERPVSKEMSPGRLTRSWLSSVRATVTPVPAVACSISRRLSSMRLDHRLPATAPMAPPTTAPVPALPPVVLPITAPTPAPMPAPTAVPFWRSLMFAQPPSSSAAATVATRAGEAGRRKVLFMRVLQARWAGALQMRRVQRQDAPVSL